MRCSKVELSYEASHMLNRYYVEVRKTYGSPRIWETLIIIAENIARLRLKHMVDDSDAGEAMKFFNVILQQLDKIIAIPISPRDVTYQRCLRILEESKKPITSTELIEKSKDSDTMIKIYLGRSLKLRENIKVRKVMEMLMNHSKVKVVQTKPLVLQYICDACDTCDKRINTPNTQFLDDPDMPQKITKKVMKGYLTRRGHIYHTYHRVTRETSLSDAIIVY